MENNILVRTEARKNWDRARQHAIFEELLALISGRDDGLLSFDEVQARLRLRHSNYRGVQDIPIDRIRGSVGRYKDFTGTFLPRSSTLRDRWERVNKIALTRGFPPIEVYQVGAAYFVLDGNHRVSIARQAGMPSIQAHVWEFVTPVGLSADADLDELMIKTEYREFLANTGLDVSCPEADIEFTAPGRYRELEYQIALYRSALERIDGDLMSYQDAAARWYDMVYTPAVQIIDQHGLLDEFPDRTEADLFIWVWRHHRELQQYGPISLEDAAEDVKRQASRPFLSRVWDAVTSFLGDDRL
jgi:hypothetical protein